MSRIRGGSLLLAFYAVNWPPHAMKEHLASNPCLPLLVMGFCPAGHAGEATHFG